MVCRLAVPLFLATLFFSTSVQAQQTRRVGPWEVTTERNRFGDGNNIVIATQVRRGVILAVRCLAERNFSLAIIEAGFGTGRLTSSTSVSAKVRIDSNPINEPDAQVLNDRAIQIDLDFDAAQKMLEGREIAIRLSIGPGTADHVFPLNQSRQALASVFQECRRPAAASIPTANPSTVELGTPLMNFGSITSLRDRFNAKAREMSIQNMAVTGSCTPRQPGRRAICDLELPSSLLLKVIGEDGSDTVIREIAIIGPIGADFAVRSVLAMTVVADIGGATEAQKAALFRLLTSVRAQDTSTRSLTMGGVYWYGLVIPGMGLAMGVNTTPPR